MRKQPFRFFALGSLSIIQANTTHLGSMFVIAFCALALVLNLFGIIYLFSKKHKKEVENV